ncbi:MAG: hypothetical protein EOM66_09895 [Clostridia bacterium]|nr:hypothetical protein [Clostridia bacterium]
MTAPKEYAPPKGIDSADEIRQVQQRLKVTADGIWGKQTQEAWDKMRSPQVQIRPAPEPSQSAPIQTPRPPIGPYKAPLVAERTSDAILERQISNSQLDKTDRGFATSFAHSLTGQQKEKLVNWMKEQGADNTISVKKLPNTVQRLIKETVTVPKEIKMSKELERSSPFRPHIESAKTIVPGVTFSNYYFDTKDGNYHVDVYVNGNSANTLTLGTQLPMNSIIRTRRMDAIDVTRETIKWLLEFYATPATLLDAYLNNKFGDNLVTSLPVIEKPLNTLDPWEHKFNYKPGRVIVEIYTPKPDVSGRTREPKRIKHDPPFNYNLDAAKIDGYVLYNRVDVDTK